MRSFALLLPIVFVAAACTAAPADDGAEVTTEGAFTEGSYVQENDPHYWAASSFEEFQVAQQSFGVEPVPTLAADDPLTTRIQVWIDRVDAIVRAKVERESGRPLAAPKPIAKVLIAKGTFNAWVSGSPVCVGAPSGKLREPGSVVFLGRENVQSAAGFAADACLHPAGWSPAGFTKFWNETKPKCAITPDGDALNVAGKSCTFDGASAEGAERLLVAATGQYIQFTTDLLAEVDEPALAVVVAHELGHYYRGHATDKGRARYNFWYQRDAAQKKTPIAARNSDELQAAYAEVVQNVKPAGQPDFASKYSARLRPLLLSGIAPLLTERTEPDFACAPARDALGAWSVDLQQNPAPSEDTREKFLDFEAKLQKCAPLVALSGEPNAKSISAGKVLFAGGQFRPGPKSKVSMTFGDNLGAFLARLDVSARDLDAKAAKLLKRMRENGIGLYTTEQEADDFAMELSTKVGLTMDEVLGGWLTFMAAADRILLRTNTPEVVAAHYASMGELDAPSCGALLKAGFTKDEGGRKVPVTLNLGALDEPHHTSCYRLFNLWREASVHKYVPGPKQAALAPEWAQLRDQAAALSAAAPAPAEGEGTTLLRPR